MFLRRVSVVGPRLDTVKGFTQLPQLFTLVEREGLHRIDHERMRAPVANEGIQHGDSKPQCLPARGGRLHDNIAAAYRPGDGFSLMQVWPWNADSVESIM